MKKTGLADPAGRRRLAARSLDLPKAAVQLLEQFFRPLDALGSDPRLMARWLAGTGIGEKSRVLDLGCGKGAVSVEVARTTGCGVVGIDAFEPFVESCRGLAAVKGVGARCDFRVGLAERFRAPVFDAVILLNVLPYERAIPIARRLTRPGGHYIFDDAVASSGSNGDRAFPSGLDVDRAIAEAGDRVARRKVWTKAEVQRRERATYELLKRNASALSRSNPEHRETLALCLRRMRAGIRDLSADIRPACWLVRRGRR